MSESAFLLKLYQVVSSRPGDPHALELMVIIEQRLAELGFEVSFQSRSKRWYLQVAK